jgi:hypothetical protein
VNRLSMRREVHVRHDFRELAIALTTCCFTWCLKGGRRRAPPGRRQLGSLLPASSAVPAVDLAQDVPGNAKCDGVLA